MRLSSIKWIFALVILLSSSLITAETKTTVNICIDEAFWYPFTMVKEGRPSGIHVDLATTAIRDTGLNAQFYAMPWKRCLRENQHGRMDAVVSASYKEERAAYLHFPEGAEEATKSPLRIMQIEYVVVTLNQTGYEFTGDITSLPQPVRVPAGYSLADDFRKKGLRVDDSAQTDTANIQKLVRDGDGSVVLIPELASLLDARVANQGKLNISATPIRSKSYYIAFSKQSALTQADRDAIWRRIAELRDNSSYIKELTAKY